MLSKVFMVRWVGEVSERVKMPHGAKKFEFEMLRETANNRCYGDSCSPGIVILFISV